jgi:hypothetical protein
MMRALPAIAGAFIATCITAGANDALNFWNSNTNASKPAAPLDIKPGGALAASSSFISGRLKCAENVNAMLRANGYRGTGSAMARSFFAYGKPVSGPRPGAIQVERRGVNPSAGHVQIVSHQQGGVWMCKNPSSRVGRWTMQPCANPRVLAYRMPTIADVDTSRAYAAASPVRTAAHPFDTRRTFGNAPILVAAFQLTEYR